MRGHTRIWNHEASPFLSLVEMKNLCYYFTWVCLLPESFVLVSVFCFIFVVHGVPRDFFRQKISLFFKNRSLRGPRIKIHFCSTTMV